MIDKRTSIIEALKAAHMKLTTPRLSVIDSLLQSDRHFTVEELYREMNRTGPTVGLATVYRTMNALLKLGIVKKLNLSDGLDRYELSDDLHQHHHLICTSCQRVIEFHEDFLDELEYQISETFHFHVKDHEVRFYGLCDECYKKIHGENHE
ncbi:Fur family transcriptional regulator [Guggenheimella bovis]